MKPSFSRLARRTAIAALLIFAVQASAEITTRENSVFSINFYNNGDTFQGLASSTMDWSEARIEQTLAASQLWIDTIADAFTSPSKINLNLVYTTFGNANIIGGSSSATVSTSSTEGIELDAPFYNEATATELKWKFGINTDDFWQSGTPWDIFIQIGKDFDFTDNGFTRVLVHEIGHALGVASYLFDNGIRSSSYNKWDSLLVDSAGNSVATSDLYTNLSSVLGQNIYLSDGTTQIQVYNPNTYAQGSSLSHPTDGSGYNVTDSILNYSGDPRTASPVAFSDLDLATLRMLGWTLRSDIVPEPATATLSLIGAFVFTIRRRRPQSSR